MEEGFRVGEEGPPFSLLKGARVFAAPGTSIPNFHGHLLPHCSRVVGVSDGRQQPGRWLSPAGPLK